MDVKIVNSPKLLLVGLPVETTLSENKTVELWRSFKPLVNAIPNRSNDNFYSVQQYPNVTNMDEFTPISPFTKWAAVAVTELLQSYENDLKTIIIPEGKYAVFKHKGRASDFFRTSQYIFGTWLPSSGYSLDNRPHFEVMTADYAGPNDPDSEELVYIPVK